MKKLVCEMCGGADLVKQDGVFVCQNCGTKYSVEEARKMMMEGTVSIEGTVSVDGVVKVDKSEELKKLYTLARRAKESDNTENAVRYYTQIEMQDPESWEAYFYLIYFKARTTTISEIPKDCKNFSNCFANALNLIKSYVTDENECHTSIEMIIKDVILVSNLMVSSADLSIGFKKMIKYRGCVYQMMERLGDEIMSVFPQYLDSALHVWKSIIEIFISEDCYGESDRESVDKERGCFIDWSGYDICNVVRKIYEIDPTYEDPFGVAKELRKNEKFITCPKCGKSFRERESACPECGCTKQEIEQIEEERRIQAEKEAEERRIQAEKEAEEARIRAEQEAAERAARRKEWWQKNWKKVIVIISILIAVIAVIITLQYISIQKSIVQANQYVASGDSCVAIYRFDEARRFYDLAADCTKDEKTQNIINQKFYDLNDARSAADYEYDQSLQRLKVLLEADDYVFNKYSNRELDKMIKIYPNNQTTIYYQNLRKQ